MLCRLFLVLLLAGPPHLAPSDFDVYARLCPELPELRLADGTTAAGLAAWRAGQMRLPEETRMLRRGEVAVVGVRSRGRDHALVMRRVLDRWVRVVLVPLAGAFQSSSDGDVVHLSRDVAMPWEAAELVAGIDAPDAVTRRAAAARLKARVTALLDDDPTGGSAKIRRLLVKFVHQLPTSVELAPVLDWIRAHEPR